MKQKVAQTVSDPSRALPIERSAPAQPLGIRVVSQLVELIVTGRIPVGGFLPTEIALCDQFGVSRTVIRESAKRLQEKGLIGVTRGRGMFVVPRNSWNMLDPVVLSAFISNDDSLGTFDELSLVRGTLEALMASIAALARSESDLDSLRSELQRMRDSLKNDAAFREADVAFHYTVMDISDNHLAANITRSLFSHALVSPRFGGITHEGDLTATLAEHEQVFAAIANGDAEKAQAAMLNHIQVAWSRRRLPRQAENHNS